MSIAQIATMIAVALMVLAITAGFPSTAGF